MGFTLNFRNKKIFTVKIPTAIKLIFCKFSEIGFTPKKAKSKIDNPADVIIATTAGRRVSNIA